MEGSKEMAKFNSDLSKQLALDMWNETNMEAQRKHMENAGLNVGLMYSKGAGAGGGATAAVQGGNVSGTASAEEPSGMGMQLGMQAAQQQANIELTNAQADLARADADKKRGVDTAKTEAETLNITQDIKNKQAVEKLTQIQGEIQELEYLLKGETFQQQKEMIGRELEKLIRTNIS